MNNVAGTNPNISSDHIALEMRAMLGLLHAVDGDDADSHTQRSLATRLGVALGFTNTLIRRCIRKGLIKVTEVPARRYAYYLTPRGFSEKSRLTAEYVACSLGFFRRAREEYDVLLTKCGGAKRIVLFGGGDLAEITVLAAKDRHVELDCIVAPGLNRETLCGVRVCTSLDPVADADMVILTDSQDPQEAFNLLLGHVPADRILTPALLNITRFPPP